jgi:predicted phosphodiesterase
MSDTITKAAILDVWRRSQTSGKPLSASGVAEVLGTTKDKVQKVLQRQGQQFVKDNTPAQNIPAPIVSTEDSAIIVADVHVPTHDEELVEKILETGKKLDLGVLYLVGDLFCQDMFSRYARVTLGPSFSDEKLAARNLMEYWMTWFDRVYFCRGNHDQRIMDFNQAQLGMEDLAALIAPDGRRKDVVASVHTKMYIDSPNTGKWLLMHQHRYNRIPLTVARSYALKHRMNVVACHQHHNAIGTVDGYTIADCGCLARHDETAYIALDISDFPDWQPGFLAMKDGVIHPYNKAGHYGIK